MHVQKTYQILNKTICLLFDNSELAHAFHKDYQAFEMEKNCRCGQINITQTGFFLEINGKAIDFSEHPLPSQYAFQVIVSEIMSQFDDFYLIHAGVVQYHDSTLILAGPPGIGKSTLTHKLINNGFTFFSDDCAPLHKTTGLIHPFPRSMWMVDSSQKNQSSAFRSKNPIPVYQSSFSKKPQQPDIVICVMNKNSKENSIHLNISLKSSKNPLIDALKKMNNVHIHQRHKQFPEYRISYESCEAISQNIQQLCLDHKQYVWQIYRVNPSRPCFDRLSSIIPVSAHEAASIIIPEMKLFDSFLNPRKNESVMASMLSISKHFQKSRCFYMTPGTLDSEFHCINSCVQRFLQKDV